MTENTIVIANQQTVPHNTVYNEFTPVKNGYIRIYGKASATGTSSVGVLTLTSKGKAHDCLHVTKAESRTILIPVAANIGYRFAIPSSNSLTFDFVCINFEQSN